MYTCRKDKISQKVEQQIRKIFATCKLVKGGANFPKDLALLSGPGPGRDNASFIHSKFLPGAPPQVPGIGVHKIRNCCCPQWSSMGPSGVTVIHQINPLRSVQL